MSTFVSTMSINAPQEFIPFACAKVKHSFESEGFDYQVKSESFNKTIITVTKGNLIKQAVGLKQGLEVSFTHDNGRIDIEAKGTVLKDQAIASALTLFVAWPVFIPQIIGMVKQSKLDERVIDTVVSAHSEFNASKPVFCTHCGKQVTTTSGVCPHCGNLL